MNSLLFFVKSLNLDESHEYETEAVQLVSQCCNMCTNKEMSHCEDFSNSRQKCASYLHNFEMQNSIFDQLLNAVDLLNQDELKHFLSKFNCSCLSWPNSLKCCMQHIATLLKDSNSIRISDYVCCKKCQQDTASKLKKQHHEDDMTSKDKKSKDKFRRKFFGEVVSSTDSSDGQDDPKREQKFTSEANEDSKQFEIPKSSDINALSLKNGHSHETKSVDAALTPRKAIIKKPNTGTHSKSNGKAPSSARKNVHFIEDPKYGLLPVTIPDWQENFREPVYSAKLNKNLPEWKK